MIEQIVFGTRGSPLALFQTNSVIEKLKVLYPDILYKRKVIETQGDRDQDSSLTLMEELGLFSNAIQAELLKNNIDAAYDKKKINEDNIIDIISEVRNGKIDGINVTIPFKKSVIPFLD